MNLSGDEKLAAGFALLHIATANADMTGLKATDRNMLREKKAETYQALLATGLTPTQLKDLGIRFLEEA